MAMRHTEIFWKPWQAADYLRIAGRGALQANWRQEMPQTSGEGTW